MSERVLHCWMGQREEIEERYGWGSPEWVDTWADGAEGTCMLEKGHTGPHEYTSDGDILVTFSEAAR